MNEIYDFFIAGRARNREKILEICNIFDDLNVSYYCFLKNEESNNDAGLDVNGDLEEMINKYENMKLDSKELKILFESDMEAEEKSKNLLLVLPAGKSGHIEAGVAYGLGKKCYAIGEYDVADSLYLIFDKIFANEKELSEFLKNNF